MNNIESYPEFDDHKFVSCFFDEKTGLKGFVAIHSKNLGPAVGGTRIFPYKNDRDALADCLRLSSAMTYKCALAGVNYGGAKAVIMGDPKKIINTGLLKSYAEKINVLGGNFFTGEDVGMSEKNVQYLLRHSPFFIGKSGVAGDPSPCAARSTFIAIKAALKFERNSSCLKGIKIAVKGVGKVGSTLVELLVEDGAEVVVADINSKAIQRLTKKHRNIEIVNHQTINFAEVDVYSPCALGNEITEKNKTKIKAKIICGGANNQLENRSVGDWLFSNGIVYVPDYIANAGGMINVVDELEQGGYRKKRVQRRIKNIRNTVLEVLELSTKKNISPERVSDSIGKRILKNGKTVDIKRFLKHPKVNRYAYS